jgi:hypothetical protein
MITSEPQTFYRVYGGKALEIAGYWTRTLPAGPLQSIIDSALLSTWGNSADHVTKIIVPSGTKFYEGYAATQETELGGSILGGGNQVYIPNVHPSWIAK